jgi:hypothetical protein
VFEAVAPPAALQSFPERQHPKPEMSSAAKFQALAASSKSADRLRNQTMFKPDLSKVL